MQLRHATALTSDLYVSRQAWREATLERCPRHPEGGCRFARHSPYTRVEPPGMRVARYYCRDAKMTFSLLPDCLASRLSSTTSEVEDVVVEAEAAKSLEAAAQKLRPDIETQGGLRWLRRRLVPIRAALLALTTLVPDVIGHAAPTSRLTVVQAELGRVALERLRDRAAEQLRSLPPPFGFGPRLRVARRGRHRFQQQTGPDPPPGRR